MNKLRYSLLLAAVLIASLPICAIGYKAVYSDHPEENGQCLQLSYMPGAYFNISLTDKVGWAKAAGATNTYIKAQLYFYTDEYLTKPASIYADDSGYLVDAVEDKQLRQSVRSNFLTQELSNTSDFYFFIPQNVVDKMSQQYANNKEGHCTIFFKLRLSDRNGIDYIKANKSFKPGYFNLTIGSKSSCGFRKYGYWTEFVGNRMERGLHFDNPDEKETLYNFKVHYYGTNLIKSESGGKYHETYSFQLFFYQDAAMTKPFLMEFNKPCEMLEGYEVASNMWDDPNNKNPDRRNYLKGVRSNLEPFDIYLRETVLDHFFHQGCGVYDVDTFVTVYFKYQPDIPSLNKNTNYSSVGCFRWWHIPPPKETIKSELVESRDFGSDADKPQGGYVEAVGERTNPQILCIWPGFDDPVDSDHEDPEKHEKKDIASNASCKHDWTYEDRRISHWCPYQARLRYGSINIDLQLVKDEKNDSILFYVMSLPVSQILYEHEMDENPSDVKNSSSPVTNVNANDAAFFIQRLNSDISEDYGIKFRVPKKNEWLLAASQLESMGKDYDEVLEEQPKRKTVRDKDGFIVSNKEVGYYTGSRSSSGKPTIKTIAQSSSSTTCIRLIADQMIESALPFEVSVATNAKYANKTNFRKVTRILQVKRCKTCGKTISSWIAD